MREFGGRLESHYREIAQALRPGLRHANLVGPVSAAGPFWYTASTVADRGVFLVGDAAGFTDPITAEGVAARLRPARAFSAALDTPNPERAYPQAPPRLNKDPQREAAGALPAKRPARL